MFSVTGYQEINYYPTGPVAKGFKSMIRLLLWKAIESLIRFYVKVETGSSGGIFTQNIIAAGFKKSTSKE